MSLIYIVTLYPGLPYILTLPAAPLPVRVASGVNARRLVPAGRLALLMVDPRGEAASEAALPSSILRLTPACRLRVGDTPPNSSA